VRGRSGPRLHQHVGDVDAGRTRQLAQLLDGLVGVVARASRADHDEDRAVACADLARARRARELALERADPVGEVEVEPRRRDGRHLLDHGSVLRRGPQVRDVGLGRQAGLVDADGDHRVEAELRKVGQVVVGQRLVAEKSVDAAQAAKPSLAGAQASPLGHLDAGLRADHRVGHGAAAIEQHADLTAEVVRELGQLARELVGEEAVGGESAPVEALEGMDLAGLEALGIAEDLDGTLSGDSGSAATERAQSNPPISERSHLPTGRLGLEQGGMGR